MGTFKIYNIEQSNLGMEIIKIYNRMINFHYNAQITQIYHMEQLSNYHCSTKKNKSIKENEKLKR